MKGTNTARVFRMPTERELQRDSAAKPKFVRMEEFGGVGHDTAKAALLEKLRQKGEQPRSCSFTGRSGDRLSFVVVLR
jgi:hypothetical protein